MSTADDASTLRRRRPPVVRINLDPAEDASDSAQSSPRAASDSSGAGPTNSPRSESESSHGSRSAQSSPRAPSAAGSSPRSFSELRVDIPRGRASPSPLESFLRSVVEAPATQRPQEIEDDEEDDDALAVASLRSVARHLTRRHVARGLRRRIGAAGGESS